MGNQSNHMFHVTLYRIKRCSVKSTRLVLIVLLQAQSFIIVFGTVSFNALDALVTLISHTDTEHPRETSDTKFRLILLNNFLGENEEKCPLSWIWNHLSSQFTRRADLGDQTNLSHVCANVLQSPSGWCSRKRPILETKSSHFCFIRAQSFRRRLWLTKLKSRVFD
jgi:hypothetical protein